MGSEWGLAGIRVGPEWGLAGIWLRSGWCGIRIGMGVRMEVAEWRWGTLERLRLFRPSGEIRCSPVPAKQQGLHQLVPIPGPISQGDQTAGSASAGANTGAHITGRPVRIKLRPITGFTARSVTCRPMLSHAVKFCYMLLHAVTCCYMLLCAVTCCYVPSHGLEPLTGKFRNMSSRSITSFVSSGVHST